MTARTAYLRRARHWIANRGLRGFAGEVWFRLRLLSKGKAAPGRENGNTAPHPFDVAYGVDTGGLLWGEALPDGAHARAAFWATGYYGISPSAFTAACMQVGLDWPDFTFVDIGCGKGRAMLLASRFPFREIVGVELSPELARIAKQNAERFEASWRCPQSVFTVLNGDATATPLPHGPLLIFLYHPFAAPLMRRFLAHVRQAAAMEDRAMYLLYANPELHGLLVQTPGVEWQWRETFSLTEEEGAADRFGSHGEIFSLYRIQPS